MKHLEEYDKQNTAKSQYTSNYRLEHLTTKSLQSETRRMPTLRVCMYVQECAHRVCLCDAINIRCLPYCFSPPLLKDMFPL